MQSVWSWVREGGAVSANLGGMTWDGEDGVQVELDCVTRVGEDGVIGSP